jgi:general secretion pathway protein G
MDRKGFTLLEIIIVVLIIGILASLAAPRIIGKADEAKAADAKVRMKNIETALRLFRLDNGFYPYTEQGLQALVEKPSMGRIPENYRPGGYLEKKKVPLDPWGRPYIYVSPGASGDYGLLSLGSDGREGGEGHGADIHAHEE